VIRKRLSGCAWGLGRGGRAITWQTDRARSLVRRQSGDLCVRCSRESREAYDDCPVCTERHPWRPRPASHRPAPRGPGARTTRTEDRTLSDHRCGRWRDPGRRPAHPGTCSPPWDIARSDPAPLAACKEKRGHHAGHAFLVAAPFSGSCGRCSLLLLSARRAAITGLPRADSPGVIPAGAHPRGPRARPRRQPTE
jgi:hypothetical protein